MTALAFLVGVGVPAGSVTVSVVGEVVHAPGIKVALAIPLPVAAVLPGRGTIAHARLRPPHHSEVPDDLPRLRAAPGARRELKRVTHGQALLEALAAVRALVFVESHDAMVESPAR